MYLVPGGVPGLGGVPGSGGVPGPGGVPGLGRCTRSHGGWGCTWSGGCTWSQGGLPGPRGVSGTPPVNRMTNRCKNITLPQTSFVGGNN